MGPNRTNLLNQGLPDEILKELNGYNMKEWRVWLAEQPEGALSLEGKTKGEWENWLVRLQRKIDEHQTLQEASEEASQTANEEPEVAGGSESGYNMV